MYKKYYGLTEKPFALLPDPRFLYRSKKHAIALAMLEYSLLEQGGITVLTGDVGCGKTTLIRSVLWNNVNRNKVAYISNTHESMGDLLEWVVYAFGISTTGNSRIDLNKALSTFLEREYSAGRKSIIIVDEAQNLKLEALEQLRLLSNINTDGRLLLQLVLVGQPELKDKLRSPGLEQFAQRVVTDYNVEPLGLEDIHQYIKYRLQVAGGDPGLFTPEAIGVIVFYSRGIPRLINILCDSALVYGFGEQCSRIDAKLVREVVHDRLKGGILPIQKELEVTKARAS